MAETSIKITFEQYEKILQQIKEIETRVVGLEKTANKAATTSATATARSFGEASKQVARLERSISVIKKTMKGHEKSIEETSEAYKTLGSAAGKGLENARQKYDKASTALAKHKALLSAARAQLNHFAKEQVVGAKNTKALGHEMLGFNRRITVAIQKIITYRIAMAVFRQIADSFRNLIKLTIDLNDVFGDLRKVLKTDAEDFTKLGDAASKMAREFGRSISEVAGTFKIFAQQGLSVNEILQRTRAVMLLVAASTMDTAEAVEALTAVVKAYPEFLNNITAAVDKWAAVQARAPVTATDLANAMKNVGIVAAEAGVDLDYFNGMVAAAAEVTRESGKYIGNAYKTIFARYPRPAVIKSLQQFGVQVMKNNQEFRDFSDVMDDLHDRWGDLGEVQQKTFAQQIGGVRRFQVFIALMKNYGRVTSSTLDSQFAFGEAERMAAIESEKFKRQFASLVAIIQEAGIAVGESGLVKDLINLAKWFTHIIDNMRGSSKATYALVKVFGIIVPITLTISAAFNSFGNLVSAMTKKMNTLSTSVALFGKVTEKTLLRVETGMARMQAFVGIISTTTMVIMTLITVVGLFAAASTKADNSVRELNEAIDEAITLQDKHTRATLDGEEALRKYNKTMDQQGLAKRSAEIGMVLTSLTELSGEFERITKLGSPPGFKKSLITPLYGKEKSGFLKELKAVAPNFAQEWGKLSTALKNPFTSFSEYVMKYFKKEMEGLDIRIPIAVGDYGDLQKALDLVRQRMRAEEDLIKYRQALSAVDNKTEKLTYSQKKLMLSIIQYNNVLRVIQLEEFRSKIEKTLPSLKDNAEELKKAKGYITTYNKEIQELKKPPRVEDYFKPKGKDPLFTIKEIATTWATAIFDIETDFKRVNSIIDENIQIAEEFGQSFDPDKTKLSNYIKLLEKARTAITDQEDSINRISNVLIKYGVSTQKIDDIRKNESANVQDILKGLKDVGVSSEDLTKEILKLLSAQKEYNSGIADARKLVTDLRNATKETADNYRNLLANQTAFIGNMARINMQNNITVELIKSQYKAYSQISNANILDPAFIQRRIAHESRIENILYQQNKAMLESTHIAAELLHTKEGMEAAAKAEESLIKLQVKHEENLAKIRINTINDILDGIGAVEKELTSTISSSLADLPSAISDRRQELNEIQARRKEFEKELVDARKAGDQSAINNAKNGLIELEQQIKNMEPLWLDIFAKIGDIYIKNWAEKFVEGLMNLGGGDTGMTWGRRFADIVTPESLKWALYMKSAIESGFKKIPTGQPTTTYTHPGTKEGYRFDPLVPIGPVEKPKKATTGTDKTFNTNNFNDLGEAMASPLENALKSGSVLLSASLLDSMMMLAGRGGAGRGSMTGGGIGSMLGMTAGEEWLTSTLGSFAGPIGTLVGTFFGGLLGSVFDSNTQELSSLNSEISKNTQALENNNKLIDLQKQVINAPSGYVTPPSSGFAGQYQPTYVFQIQGNNPNEIANEVRRVVNEEYNNQMRTTSNTQRRFGI